MYLEEILGPHAKGVATSGDDMISTISISLYCQLSRVLFLLLSIIIHSVVFELDLVL